MFFNFLDLISPYYYNTLLAASFYFFLICLANQCEIRRSTLQPLTFDGPLVSVLIPARNEEMNIERCLASLRSQTYNNYEILVLNDNSTDKTQGIINRIAGEDGRVRVFNGDPLPDDWYGKPFALHQLTAHAKGELLIFTDADTIHAPTSIAWAAASMQGLNADMISGYVGQVFRTFGEVITGSLMYILTGFAIPIFLNRFVKVSWFSVAIGQFIVIKKDVLKAIGGLESFKKETSEDIYLSRRLKRKGYKTCFLNITEHITCRMYDGHHAAIEGIGKNLLDFFGKSAVFLFLLILGVIFIWFLPFPLLLYNIVTSNQWIFHNLIFVCLYTLTWALIFFSQRLKWWYCFLWPVLMLNLIYMAAWSWFRNVSGKGFLWKDRTVGRRERKTDKI